MKLFKIIGWIWLVFGALGFLCTCCQFATRLDLVFTPNGFLNSLPDTLEVVFTFFSALAGFGLLRRWHWARIAIEILASILFTCSIILFLGVDDIPIYGLAAGFSFWSLLIALFVRYELPDKSSEPS
jgi:hypothetical protein